MPRKQRYERKPRLAMQGKIIEIEPRVNDEGVKYFDLTLDDDRTYRVFSPFGKTLTEQEWDEISIAKNKKFSDIKEGCTVRFLYYISNNEYPVISFNDLKSFEIVEDAEPSNIKKESNEASSPFISLAKCPNCNEKMAWMKPELNDCLREIFKHSRKLYSLILKWVDEK